MKTRLLALILSMILIVVSTTEISAQGTSNKGTDFWFVYAPHVNGYTDGAQKMSIYVTSEVNTSGKLEIPGIGYKSEFSVTANQVTIVNIPQAAYSGGIEGKNNTGIHLTSLKPIVAYGHIYSASMSGATLLLPTNTLGKDYYSINFTQKANSQNAYSFCLVVATEDNTQIVIKPSVNTTGGFIANTENVITLDKGEVYQIFGKQTSEVRNNAGSVTMTTGDDLTGTTIRSIAANGQSCKRIAVFSGSTRVSIGCATATAPGSADNLFQQVYPTSTWGKSFVTVPSKNRNYDIYRVFKSSPTAVVKVNGVIIPNTNFIGNLYYEFASQQTNYIESDNTIQVVQYQVTQGKQMASANCTSVLGDVGDPEMIFLNPLEQTLDKMTMYSSPFHQILRHYINVVIKTTDVGSFTLDGVSRAASFSAVPNKVGYAYAQIEVSEGTHTLQAGGGFNAIAYGFGAVESYGYAAGASLISPGIEVSDEATSLTKEMGCLGLSYGVSVSLPYQPLKIMANLDDGAGDRQATLNLTSTFISNNITYYKYQLFSNIVFSNAKKYFIKLFAEKPSPDGCGAVDQLEIEYEIFNFPDARFAVSSDKICEGGLATFSDNSIGNGGDIVKWYWDFGDGTNDVKSTATPFDHTYAPGLYTAKLVVENQAGCLSQAFTKQIVVYKVPQAAFEVQSLLCEKQLINFVDKSRSLDGAIIGWRWDFGDGNSSTLQNPFHEYIAFGAYDVKLTVISEFGCESTVLQRLRINELPNVDFEVPDFCMANGNPTFTNRTSISSTQQLFYSWDFGDGSPISTVTSPVHTYSSSGTYNVKLTVSTASGCIAQAVSKIFKVFPKMQPAFTTEGVTCAQNDILFKDQSTIENGGSITKWIWDMGDGLASLEKLNAQPFYYRYADPGTYIIKLILVSSDGCTSETFEKAITVNHLPVAAFKLPDFCIADGSAVFINQSTIPSNEQLTYVWDFGDAYANAQRPNISTQVNGTHNYTRTGIYEVTLTVKSTSGCTSVIKKQFTVNGSVPNAIFEVVSKNQLCSNTSVVFKDLATVDFGEITKIEWFFDFANSTTQNLVDEDPNLRSEPAKRYDFQYPSFTNALSKTYVVKMKAYSGGTCVSEQLQTITLYPQAVPAFSLNEECLAAGVANFTNLTTHVDPAAALTYVWNFGDEFATSSNPNTSTANAPAHKYSRAGTYNVTLTVKTQFGCESKIEKEIIIRGAVPVADFAVENNSRLCVQNSIAFQDKTLLAFGEITRIDWYYDFANNPNQVEQDLNPGTRINPKLYTHQYPSFSFPFSKNFIVRMVAYSGELCKSIVEKNITIYATPDIQFNAPLAVCQELPSIILVAKEISDMPGTGQFSGKGVNSNGVFIPANAGLGEHSIKYTFTSNNGCTTEKSQVIVVNETPIVDAGEDKTVLEGGQNFLSATAYGKNLTYKWSPSKGLDRDDVLNPVVTATEDVIYTLTVSSSDGCSAKDDVRVKYLKNLVIPNAITPNGDSVNDVWNLRYIDSYPTASVDIYNRSGQRVFTSQGYLTPFDGTYNGKNLPVGTYYYIIKLDSKRKPLSGTLTIIR